MRYAEIHHLYCSVIKQHYILRFDISVHNTALVGMTKRAKGLLNIPYRFVFGNCAGKLHIFLKRSSLYIFHYDILYIALEINIVNVNDIRMRKHCYGA